MAFCLALMSSALAVTLATDADDTILFQMDKVLEEMSLDEKTAVSSYIEKAFSHITGDGTYFNMGSTPAPTSEIETAFSHVTSEGSYIEEAIHQDATWQKCTSINWTKVAQFDSAEDKLHLPTVEAMLQELSLTRCLPGGDMEHDDTCKAVWAAIEVAANLSHSTYIPAFANFSVTTWGKYPSWVVGTVEGLDYTQEMPVKVTLKYPKGVIGYAVCDMLRVVLTQSADQMSTGTCSYVASLAALIRHAPAKVIKIATRLFWTGMITPSLGKPCDLIFHQQPGLIPFKNKTGGYIPDLYQGGGPSSCSGNSMDCAAGNSKPQQNIGLTFSWTQSLISLWMKKNWGFCEDDAVRAGIAYPGQSHEDATMATRNQGGWYNSMMWECKNVLDPDPNDCTCQLVMNPFVCPLGVIEICVKKWEMEPAARLQTEIVNIKMLKYKSEAYAHGIVDPAQQLQAYVIPKLKEELNTTEHKLLYDYLHFLIDLADKYGVSLENLAGVISPKHPSFTEVELNETCNSHVNMLVIDSKVLDIAQSNPQIIYKLRKERLPAFGNFGLPAKSHGCNHAVYLESCDYENNEYRIWTWGTTVTLSREILLGYPTTQQFPTAPGKKGATWNTGAICAAVVASKISIN